MKKTFLNLSVLLVLFVSGTVAVSAVNTSTTTRKGVSRTNIVKPERHPMIRRAISALEAAKGDLQSAAHDFCGHREEAKEAANRALEQLRKALESDRSQLITPKDSTETAMFVNASYDMGGLEQHPRIKAAIRALENAKNELQHAAHDFKGHRDEAIEAVNNAINQLRAAIACDRR